METAEGRIEFVANYSPLLADFEQDEPYPACHIFMLNLMNQIEQIGSGTATADEGSGS